MYSQLGRQGAKEPQTTTHYVAAHIAEKSYGALERTSEKKKALSLRGLKMTRGFAFLVVIVT